MKPNTFEPERSPRITEANGQVFVPLASDDAGWYRRRISRKHGSSRMVVRYSHEPGKGSIPVTVVQWFRGRISISTRITTFINDQESVVVPPEVLRHMLKK